MVGQEVAVEEHVLESWVVGGVLAATDVEGDQQDKRASPGRAPSPHSSSLFTYHRFGVLSKIDCRTIGLKEVERECNNLGKNSHFLGKVCFVWFWVEKSAAKRKTILNSPPPLLCYPCNSSPYLALGRSEIVFYQLRLNILTHIVKLYDFLE